MSRTGLAVFDNTVQTTNVWLHEVMRELGWDDRHRAYQALRAVLHAVRDRMTVAEAADLGAQLPMLVRGLYFEGWNPAATPARGRDRERFLAPVSAAFKDRPDVIPEAVVWAVFKVLEKHVSAGEIDEVKRLLPEPIRTLCP